MKRCDADEHLYDETKHSECPYCRKTKYVRDDDPKDDPGRGRSRGSGDRTRQVSDQSKGKTRVIFSGRNGTSIPEFEGQDQPPVVGWLVIVDGPGIGQDLRITAGFNRIGRDPDMSIQIDFGDEAISRQEHAVLVFDAKNNVYRIKHGSGQNLTYVNGESILDATPLQAHDEIELGKTKLRFIPLCTEDFSWG